MHTDGCPLRFASLRDAGVVQDFIDRDANVSAITDQQEGDFGRGMD